MRRKKGMIITLINLTLPSLQDPKKALSWLLADIPDWFDILDTTAPEYLCLICRTADLRICILYPL
jgi:hypothetical protein